MAEVIEDPKKKKASFGDAAAAATDPGITQLNVGKPGDFPVNPDGTPMQKMAAGALPPAPPTEKPPGFATATLAPAAGALPPSAPIDPQTLSDRQAVGRVWDGIKSMNRSAGAAIADVATLPLRGVAGAYDSAVVRPMRAAGVNAAYLSPKLVPDGANVDSMTPFYDQIRSRENALAQAQAAAPTAAPKVIPGAGDATMPGNDPTRFMAPAQSDAPLPAAPNPTAEGKDVGFGVRRIDAPGKSPLFTNVASAADNAALQGRGSISAQNMGAAQGLSDTFAAEGRAAAQKAQYDQEVATAQAINARPIPKDTGGFGILSKEYQDRRNASFAPPSVVGDKARNAAILAQNKALDDQALENVRSDRDEVRVSTRERGATERAVLQERGTNARFGATDARAGQSHELAKQRLSLDSRRADIADTGAQMDNATKKQIQDLNAAILKEPAGPKRDAMLETHQTLTGKYQRPDPATRMTVVPQGSYFDEKSQQVLQRPALVLGPDGQVIGLQQAQQAQHAAATVKSQADFDKLKKGDTYTGEDGKTYRK